MMRSVLGILVLLCCSTTARAGLDPELDKPYRLQVVLRIAENRLLTPVFGDLVQRQLRDSLQAALGELARVEIVHEHPLLKEVEAKGLQLALDGYWALSDTKTHFVLIDFVNGRYEIQARQHDGFTGLPSRVVRQSSTGDRWLVARLAALLIDQDFGLAGTLQDEHMQGEQVEVKFKGGGLGVPLDHWVKKDQVFAVAQMIQGSTQQRSFQMPWTLLQVLEESKGGSCRCRLLHRKDNPLPRVSDVQGYRCLKLGTTVGPVRLRVVADDKLTPLNARQVLIDPRSFDPRNPRDRKVTGPDGLVQSEHSYENVAFVTIYEEGGSFLARIPVEIVAGLTVTCPVSTSAAAVAKGLFYERRRRWLRRLYDDWLVAMTVLPDELNALAGQSDKRLARARAGLTALETDLASLTAERARLGAELPPGTLLDLKEGEQPLQDLRDRRDELRGYIAQLEQISTEEKDPKRQQWKAIVAEADRLEGDAEFDKAIALYQRVLTEGGEFPQLQAKLDTLNRAWATKSEAHKRAREFIYLVWPKQDSAANMKARLGEARKAFATCKETGDVLSPRKLLKTSVTHTAQLAKEGDSLQSLAREDERKTAETIVALSEELRKFNEEVRDYLKNAKLPGKESPKSP